MKEKVRLVNSGFKKGIKKVILNSSVGNVLMSVTVNNFGEKTCLKN